MADAQVDGMAHVAATSESVADGTRCCRLGLDEDGVVVRQDGRLDPVQLWPWLGADLFDQNLACALECPHRIGLAP